MKLQYKIANYLVDEYGFEIVPCSIPMNDFEYTKRDIYIWVDKHISRKLFQYLNNILYPIKFLKERHDASVYLYFRNKNKKIILEICIDQIHKFQFDQGYSNEEWRILSIGDYNTPIKILNNENYIKNSNEFLSNFHIFVPIIRKKTINQILNQ